MRLTAVPQELLEGLFTMTMLVSMNFKGVDWTIHENAMVVVVQEGGVAKLQIKCGNVTTPHPLAMEIILALIDSLDNDQARPVFQELYEKSFTFNHAKDIVNAIIDSGAPIPLLSGSEESNTEDVAEFVKTIFD